MEQKIVKTVPLNIIMLFELGPDDNGNLGGGVENHAFNLSKALVKRGHRVEYLTGTIPHNNFYKEIDGLNIHRVDLLSLIKRAYHPQQLTFSRQLCFLLRSFMKSKADKIDFAQSDIIHGHVYSSGLAALRIGQKWKKPTINTIHGSYYKYWSDLTKNPVKAQFYKSMERVLAPYLAKKCSYQIHTDWEFANFVKGWVKEKYKEKIVSIMNGVDISKFSPTVKANIRLADYSSPLIITTRRLVYKNGVVYLVRSMKKVLRTFPDANLVIIGDGPEKVNISNEIKRLELTKNVHLLGMIPNDNIASFLVGADIVVVPSIVEASSISVLEAMATKRPVVASDIPGIREITEKGKYCYLVESRAPEKIAEGICYLLKEQQQSEEMAELAYQNVLQYYSWDQKAKEVEAIYYKAIENYRN